MKEMWHSLNFAQKVSTLTVFFIGLVLVIGVARFFEPRLHYTGDGISSVAVWMGGKHFHDYGFTRLRFVPIQVDQRLPDQGMPPIEFFYTHYPPGPDLVQGALFRLGLETPFAHQMFAVLVAMIGILFAWKSLNVLLSPWPALLAWGAFIFSPSFFFFADSLHQYPWLVLFKWLFLYRILCLHWELQAGLPVSWSKKWIEFFCIGLFPSWFSFDIIPSHLALSFVILFILPRTQRFRVGLPLLMAAPAGELVGFLLHIAHNGLVFGGLIPAFRDIGAALLVRGGFEPQASIIMVYSVLKHGVKLFWGFQWFFTLPMLVISLLGWLRALKRNDLCLGLFFATGFGGLAWQVLMRQHGMVHGFTIRHFDLFAALGFGLFWEYYKDLKSRAVGSVVACLFLVHAGFAIEKVEFVGIKRYLVSALVSPERELAWACNQNLRKNPQTELVRTQAMVNAIVQQDCPKEEKTEGLNEKLAEFILYWR